MSVSAGSTLTQLQNDTNRVQYENSRKNLGSNRLDRDSFIQLIMAQIQYQDPTNPSADMTQMLSQQLQLEQADQMNRMVQSNQFAQASNMIGQVVELVDARWDFQTNRSGAPEWDVATNSPRTVMGVVESVQFDRVHGKALAKIGNHYYDVEQIRQVIHPMALGPNPEGGN